MKEILLINISGEDRPGLTAAIAEVLAEFDVNVLDVGQAVIHDGLSLGLLVELPEPAVPGEASGTAPEPAVPGEASGTAPESAHGAAGGTAQREALKEAIARSLEPGLQVKFTPISEASYQHWVTEQGQPRYIVTLLARKITARHLAEVTGVVSRHGLNIDAIKRLSGRVSLGEQASPGKACVEFSVRGRPSGLRAFREQLLELAGNMDIDLAFQEDNKYRRHRRLVAFDMDSTLVEAEVIDELAAAAGVGPQVAEITERAMRGEVDFCESLRSRVKLLAGLDISVLEQVATRLPLTEGAKRLVSTLQSLGYKTAILSGGFNYFAQRLQEQLGIDYIHANDLDIKNGQLTGKISGDIVDGQRKAELLQEIADHEGIDMEQVISVGDGANDLPMLGISGLGIAFRAKPLVRQSAEQAISTLGLDGILYLLGISDRDSR